MKPTPKFFFNELKTIAFIADALNSLVFYAVAVSGISFGVLGLILIGASLVMLIYRCRSIYKSRKQSTNGGACCELMLQVLFGSLMILSTTMYFVGDNLISFVTKYKDLKCDPSDSNSTEVMTCGKHATVSSIYLLIFGIIGFRFIPLVEKKTRRILKLYQNNNNNNTDNKQRLFYTTAIESLAIITELDAWYTALTTLTKNSVFKSTCSNYILTGYWLAVFLIMIILGIYFALAIINIDNKKCTMKQCCNKKCTAEDHHSYIALMFTIWITSGLYILGDNKEPLDCYKESSSQTINPINIIQLSFVCGSLFFYIGVFVISLVVPYWKRRKNKRVNKCRLQANETLDNVGEDIKEEDSKHFKLVQVKKNQLINVF